MPAQPLLAAAPLRDQVVAVVNQRFNSHAFSRGA